MDVKNALYEDIMLINKVNNNTEHDDEEEDRVNQILDDMWEQYRNISLNKKASRIIAVMNDVSVYSDDYAPKLCEDNGRLTIVATNEGGYNSTSVDLLDLISWIKENIPDLLTETDTTKVVESLTSTK